ncbi:hypothetical protein QBC40DRAFT_219558 [Triangularia verruculosa]|uniref:DUF3669 domain-containing protein n=1 Tax=Triangularia verruculosa TaxID=2587418 RepID=A0AAN7AYL0_9PEZI|nr:hypothetical protein QBC40DRAFT_219558 [Triangularia verruculosa]
MDRRNENATDDSSYSVSSDIKRDAKVAQRYLSADELSAMPSEVIIRRSLTVNSIISTTSTFARRYQEALNRPDLQQINEIGRGLQGAVFEQVGKSLVMKKEHPGNATERTSLAHEFAVHRAVVAAFNEFGAAVENSVHVPEVHNIVFDSDKNFWDAGMLDRFPQGYRVKGTVVRMERILPLPKVIRKAFIHQFYPAESGQQTEQISQVLSRPENKHCLARVYLGREVGPVGKADSFSLRNFPLYLKAMKEFGLDVSGLASAMGKAFAIMHWGAGVNGDDVEFVLGTSAVKEQLGDSFDFQHRAVGFYLLDFGQCDRVNLEEDDADEVYQAFKGAMVMGDNQLFIPHYEKSREIFAAFKQGYLLAGQSVIEKRGLEEKFDIGEFMREYEEYAEDFL